MSQGKALASHIGTEPGLRRGPRARRLGVAHECARAFARAHTHHPFLLGGSCVPASSSHSLIPGKVQESPALGVVG